MGNGVPGMGYEGFWGFDMSQHEMEGHGHGRKPGYVSSWIHATAYYNIAFVRDQRGVWQRLYD